LIHNRYLPWIPRLQGFESLRLRQSFPNSRNCANAVHLSLFVLKQSSQQTLGPSVVKTVDTPLGPDLRQDDGHSEWGFLSLTEQHQRGCGHVSFIPWRRRV